MMYVSIPSDACQKQRNLSPALKTRASIYAKLEGGNPRGSHGVQEAAWDSSLDSPFAENKVQPRLSVGKSACVKQCPHRNPP